MIMDLEESILLNCPFYLKKCTDSMQFTAKFQQHFSQN